ncbi:hypothetical protein AAFF_G00004060 [Aldrovandia affinis]|uniref:Ubiquitin-like protease family profile domain-containing protein n=1 Tax=Aldrovandia affinis TaxID=143900 RepID=A0AAD7TDD9_9TELE|nr:hypothetical protein AAFF_G00004060 [Aldrovandia affinis]
MFKPASQSKLKTYSHRDKSGPKTKGRSRNVFKSQLVVNRMFGFQMTLVLVWYLFGSIGARRAGAEDGENSGKINSARCTSRCLNLHMTQLTASFKHLQSDEVLSWCKTHRRCAQCLQPCKELWESRKVLSHKSCERRWNYGIHPSEDEASSWQTILMTMEDRVVLKDVRPHRWYQFRVSAVNSQGTRGFTTPSKHFYSARDPFPPETPRNLRRGNFSVRADGSGVSVPLLWDPPAREGDLAIHHYKITWSVRMGRRSGQDRKENSRVTEGATGEMELEGLRPDTAYLVQVQAVGYWGPKRLKSSKAQLTFTTAPAADSPVVSNHEQATTEVSNELPSSDSAPNVLRLEAASPHFHNNQLQVKVFWKRRLQDTLKDSAAYLLRWYPEVCTNNVSKTEKTATVQGTHFVITGLLFSCKYRVAVMPTSGQGQRSEVVTSVTTPQCSALKGRGLKSVSCTREERHSLARKAQLRPERLTAVFSTVNGSLQGVFSWQVSQAALGQGSIAGFQFSWAQVSSSSSVGAVSDTLISQTQILAPDQHSLTVDHLQPESVYKVQVQAFSTARCYEAFVPVFQPQLLNTFELLNIVGLRFCNYGRVWLSPWIIMYHCHPQRAVKVTTLAIPRYTWPGVKRRPLQTAARRIPQEQTVIQLKVKFASKKGSEARRKPWRSTPPIPLKFVAKVAKHGNAISCFSSQLAYSSPKENTPARCLVVKSGRCTGRVPASGSSKVFLPQKTVKKITRLTDNNNLFGPSAGETGQSDKLTKIVASAKQPEPKSSGPTDDKVTTSLPLMRCLFDVQNRCRVGKSHIGSLGKERKAKNLTRISTLRGRRLKAEVLGYLSGLSAESKELIREVNGDDLLRLKRKSQKGSEEGRDGVGPPEGNMVHNSSVPEASQPTLVGTHGRTSGRKRTPKACDCCGPNCRPKASSLEKPERRSRKKKIPEAEQPTTSTPVARDDDATSDDHAPLNGGSGSEGDSQLPTDMEVELPMTDVVPVLESPELEVPVLESPELELTESSPGHCMNPLLDHRYCKTKDGDSTDMGSPEGEQEERRSKNQLLTIEITDEDLTELIHEFLEHFYGTYGSFIPLSEGDVLEHLNKKLNSDLTNRKTFIYSEVTKYRAGLACAPMHYFKVAYNKHTLTLEDLSTLEDQNWVNDQVINMYGELIMEAVNHKVHFFNSFFHRQLVAKGYEGVKRWTKKVDLFTKSLLLIPIHLEIHWSLITVDITNQHIHFYDSQGIMFKYAVENILKYILAEAKEKQHTVYQKGWKMIVNKSIPQQKNDSDCGVFVLEYCKCLALEEPLQFTQEDMPKVRKRIYKELCECKLRC